MKNITLIIATGFGLGNSQILPGTLGTLLGIIPAIFILSQSLILQIVYCFIIVFFGFLVCNKAAKIIGEKDPSCIVADEFCTLPITVIGFSDPIFILSGFIFHRFFDILKPWPIKKLEELPGGLGIILDDFLSAIFALIINMILFVYHF
ncbi:MAG: phosphatidylglycerophosphatase A [Verrucomicrobiota bacterium]|nr:phosphatidylglycerophosphatase A [Verrucomicrobiota bacterium]MEC8753649.1 phosphatidylglycerophosphatase A [Verrucomicrobiota bacterium]